MKRLFESFRRYALLTEEQLLVEGRKDDAKKKYPKLAEAGLLDILIEADPSGNQKYLMWAAKMLDNEIKTAPEADPAISQVEAENVAEYIQKFHKLQPYIRGEDKKFKDINNIKSLNAMIELESKKKKKRQCKAHISLLMMMTL